MAHPHDPTPGAEAQAVEDFDRRIFHVFSGISETFGGGTTVMLHRADFFARCLGRPSTILTTDADCDIEATRARLEDQGYIGPDVDLRNVWHDLGRFTDADLHELGRARTAAKNEPEPLRDVEFHSVEFFPTHRVYRSKDRSDLRTERLRPDGTVHTVIDDQGPRRITLLDTEGEPIAEFPNLRAVYFAWFDLLRDGAPALFLSDSKPVGGMIHQYRRKDVFTAQVIHARHQSTGAGNLGPFSVSRWGILDNHEHFDILAFLTDAQRHDFEETFGKYPNRFTIPNGREVPSPELESARVRELAEAPRDPTAGMVVARLDPNKRIDMAIMTVARARERLAASGATEEGLPALDVYGTGPIEDELRRLVATEGLEESVRLHGQHPGAAEEFARASFMILASRSEALPLVVIEAMGRGCIPIVTDVKYGPRDLVDDGVNGFLVSEDDPEALTARVCELVRMSPERLSAMRSSALSKAQDFSNERMLRRWVDAVRTVEEARLPHARGVLPQGSLSSVAFPGDRVEFTGTLAADHPVGEREVHADLVTRRDPYILTVPVEVSAAEATPTFTFSLPRDMLAAPPGQVYDVFLRNAGAAASGRARISGLGEGPETTGLGLKVYSTMNGNLSVEIVEDIGELVGKE